MEVMLLRQNSIEHRLKALFTEGDDNGDGVLSFEEFNKIVGRYALLKYNLRFDTGVVRESSLTLQ